MRPRLPTITRLQRTLSAYHEISPGTAAGFDPVTAAIESGKRGLLIGPDAMPPEFFDLSTGVAGSIVQRLTMYGIRMAVVVPDPSIHSASFQDFAREANAGRVFRFFPDRGRAVAWLSRE